MGTSRNVVGTGTGLERAERDFRKMFGTTGTLEPEKIGFRIRWNAESVQLLKLCYTV